jgi:hypothetical protein
MKVRILGDWTYRKGGQVYTCESKPFDMDDEKARRFERRLMVEIIPAKEDKNAKT